MDSISTSYVIALLVALTSLIRDLSLLTQIITAMVLATTGVPRS